MDFNKQLYLKLTDDKPPFIGILHTDTFFGKVYGQGLLGQEYWIDMYIHFNEDYIKLYLVQEGYYHLYHYDFVKYDKSELQEWLQKSLHAPVINFGHVVLKNELVELEQTDKGKQPFFFPIRKLYVMDDAMPTVIVLNKAVSAID